MLLCMAFVALQLFQATIVHFVFETRKLLQAKRKLIEQISERFKAREAADVSSIVKADGLSSEMSEVSVESELE